MAEHGAPKTSVEFKVCVLVLKIVARIDCELTCGAFCCIRRGE